MSNKLVLYNVDFSPPVRTVKIVAKLIGVELEIRNINTFDGEHLRQPFIKLNPEHTVPTLVDGDFVIWDSHAICAYLVDKYAKDDKLYPKDLPLRAKCNQRLFFEAGSLFVRLRDCTLPILFGGATEVPQDKLDSMKSSLDILEAFLVTDPFLAGSNLTIADISVAMSVYLLDIYVPIKLNTHPKTSAWLKRVSETVPVFDEINAEELKQFRERVMNALEKNKENK